MELHRVVTVLTVLGSVGALAVPLIRSDPLPWASISRVDEVRSDILSIDIRINERNYCDAERMHNALAAQAVTEDINTLEQEYAKLNNGMELPIRPCP